MQQGLLRNEGVLDMLKSIIYIGVVNQDRLISAVPHLRTEGCKETSERHFRYRSANHKHVCQRTYDQTDFRPD